MKLFLIATLTLISNIAFAGNEGMVQPFCPDGIKIEGTSCPVDTARPGLLTSPAGTWVSGSDSPNDRTKGTK